MNRSESTLPLEGWYPDPRDEDRLRWWDGTRWTPHTAERKTPPAPEPAGDEVPAPKPEPAAGRQPGSVAAPAALLIPRRLAAGGAIALILSLFLTWYTLQLGLNGVTVAVPLASSAFQWMSSTAIVLTLLAVGVLAVSLGSFADVGFAPALRRLIGPAAVVWPGAAVLLIIYRMIDPPLLPGSDPVLHLQGSVDTGAWIALLCALTMTAGMYLFVREANAAADAI